MNLSGESVGPLMRYYKIDPSDVYCIYDDMDLPIGKLRIRPMVVRVDIMGLNP